MDSPYLLAPGPERRRVMRELGIPICLLDYSDAEWAARSSDAADARARASAVGSVRDAVRDEATGT